MKTANPVSNIVATRTMAAHQRAFTLIELMIVIAIIAIIAAIAIPSLLRARVSSNESATIGDIRTLISAQAAYQGVNGGYYDGALSGLAELGLIDPVLGSGTKHGYNFAILAADNFTWSASAVPAVPGKSGDRSFFVDESGVIRFEIRDKADRSSTPIGGIAADCPDAEVLARCCPVERPEDTVLTSVALKTIALLDELAPGALDGAIQFAASNTFVQAVLSRMDRNNDGRLDWNEVLETDVLALARSIAQQNNQGGGPSIGNDDALRAIANPMFEFLPDHLQLGVAGEELPAVQLTSLQGTPVSFLLRARPETSLSHLQELINGLATDPRAGEMMAPNMRVNQARKQILAGYIDDSLGLVAANRLDLLAQKLRLLRQRADGDFTPPDWVMGTTAMAITNEVDLLSSLLALH